VGFIIEKISMKDVACLCSKHHGYKSSGGTATYAFGVVESGLIVAAYAWQPPPPGAAKSVCSSAPYGVLALSRMVALPKDQRTLKHISKPLMMQMKSLIDRGRWPVLITYSDEGLGHDGYVYQCSGWEKTARNLSATYCDESGARTSSYQNGQTLKNPGVLRGKFYIQRWEHWACERGCADKWIESHGWARVPIVGKVWKSGAQAYTYKKVSQ
jgi:hypothetical protein